MQAWGTQAGEHVMPALMSKLLPGECCVMSDPKRASVCPGE